MDLQFDGTTVPGGYERITQPIYSSAQLATGGLALSFFTTVLGAAAGGVWGSAVPTLEDTNMTVAGSLPAGYAHVTRAVSLQTRTTISRADINALFAGGALNFRIGSKDQFQVPISCLPGGQGVEGVIKTADGAGNESLHFGVADPRAVYALTDPIIIRPNQNITAQIQWGAAVTLAATQPIRLIFHGQLFRPVQ